MTENRERDDQEQPIVTLFLLATQSEITPLDPSELGSGVSNVAFTSINQQES